MNNNNQITLIQLARLRERNPSVQTRHTTPPASSGRRSKGPRLGLQDLKQGTIHCMICAKESPAAGSTRFHAFHVCLPCSQRLKSLPEKSND